MKQLYVKYIRDSIVGRIFISYSIIVLFSATLFYSLIPNLLNYAPGYSYIDALHGLNYTVQYIIMGLFILLVGFLIIFFSLRGVKEIEDYLNNPGASKPEHILTMKRKFLHLPYMIYIIQIAVPVIVVSLMILPLFILEQASLVVFFKVFILFAAFFILVSIITLVISERIFKRLLRRFEPDTNIEGIRIPLGVKLYIQILPMFIIAILFTILIGYSNNIRDKGNLICDSYLSSLNDTYIAHNNEKMDSGRIKDLLYKVRAVDGLNDVRFIITPAGQIITSDGKELGGYFLEYLNELSKGNGGYVYDVTEEIRGVIVNVPGEDGNYTVGIKFDIGSIDLVAFYSVSFIFILFLCSIVLYFLSKAMSEDISTVANSLSEIASGEYVSLNKKVAISSNDEISDLVIAYNRIQELVQDHIKQIRYNHDVLIQHERLVSLGQLIGGIAHSLKTPISTASDTALCIENLTDEYDKSIEDSVVTKEDHHGIASEIKGHLNDLKETLDYINSIINTVKNHSADLDKSVDESFAVKDLVNSVNILMSNELKKNSCRLNINTNMADDELLQGDMRSLIQIINVLISNAIQAYPIGNGQIDFVILKGDHDIKIVVRDYGVGIPKGIQDKLLNKMVTTRGSKGTGIGLYISNSIIKAKFNGSLSFESEEGKGTTFRIILPIRKEADKL